MPNWCENELVVEGESQKEINRFAESHKYKSKDYETDLSFMADAPTPKPLQKLTANGTIRSKMIEKYGASDWYGWRLKNWGTKWDTTDAELTTWEKHELIYNFETAWSPPIEWLAKASANYPTLHFRLEYGESGNYFAGFATAHAGKVVDKEIPFKKSGFYHPEDEE